MSTTFQRKAELPLSQKVIARAIKDDPWMVSARPPKEMYVPGAVQCSRVVKRVIPVAAQVTAKEAREHGVELASGVPDNQIVDVEVPEEIEEEQSWWETRLCFKGRLVQMDEKPESVVAVPQRGHRQKMREEIAAAIESPLSFVHYDKLVELVLEEIDHWKSNNMHSHVQRPIVLVLLGVREREDDHDNDDPTYSRSVYFIKKYSLPKMILVSPKNEELEVELEPGTIDLCHEHNFVLFAPANLHFYDTNDEELV